MNKTVEANLKVLNGRIAIRDLITKNLLEALIDEETGQAYLESLKVADAELRRALKVSVGD